MSLSYDEMLGLTEEKLEKMGVTKVINKTILFLIYCILNQYMTWHDYLLRFMLLGYQDWKVFYLAEP